MYADRLPPHDANAEESVIGSVLIDGDSLHKVSSLIRPTDFYGEKNRWCYEAFLGLAERGEAINQVTVSHELSLQERLESLGGSAYLSHLVMVVPTSVHIEYYAGIVQRTSVHAPAHRCWRTYRRYRLPRERLGYRSGTIKG